MFARHRIFFVNRGFNRKFSMHTAHDLEELVVLLDDTGRAVGTAPKLIVHDTNTHLHLAFSCYVQNSRGEILITRRALTKKTWPGVWTNSFCGHPLPGEPMAEALSRRAEFELGLKLEDFTVALPDFRYRAVDSSGIVENEICPVYTVTTTAEPQPNADEAMDYVWVSPQALRSSAEHTPWAFSPWLVLQLNELDFSRSSAAAQEQSESISA